MSSLKFQSIPCEVLLNPNQKQEKDGKAHLYSTWQQPHAWAYWILPKKAFYYLLHTEKIIKMGYMRT